MQFERFLQIFKGDKDFVLGFDAGGGIWRIKMKIQRVGTCKMEV